MKVQLYTNNIGGGTRGTEALDSKIYASARPPQISTPEITQYWLEIILKHAHV